MKRTNVIIISLLLISGLFSCRKEKEVKDEFGNLYARFEYYENKYGSFIKHGKYQSWHDNNMIKSKGKYKHNLREGIWNYFNDNGIRIFEFNYKDGLKSGDAFAYNERGVLMQSSSYRNDTLNGKQIFYFENGVIRVYSNYVNGLLNGTLIRRDSLNNITFEENYLHGEKHGKWILYRNGEKYREFNFSNGVPDEIVGRWKVSEMRRTIYEFTTDGTCIITTPVWRYPLGRDPLNEYIYTFEAETHKIEINNPRTKSNHRFFFILEIDEKSMKLFDIISKKEFNLTRI